MPEFQARPDEVSGAVPFRFVVAWTCLYAQFPETSVGRTALQQTTNSEPWTRPPTEAEISWAMVVPKMQGARPRRRVLEIAPAPAPAPARNGRRFARMAVICSSAIASAALLLFFLHAPPKPPQAAPRLISHVPPIPARAVESDTKPARKPQPVVTRKPRVIPPPLVESTIVESSPPPPMSDAPDRVATSARVHAPPVHGPYPLSPIMLGGFESSRVLTKVKPVYPEAAAIAKVEGTVRVRATIGENGAVKGVELESGPAMLFQAASDAVRQWRFLPARLNGDPVEDVTHVNITFGLVK
jgi:periplasmic protein TonB